MTCMMQIAFFWPKLLPALFLNPFSAGLFISYIAEPQETIFFLVAYDV
jgi:hypothetical protein